MIRVREYLNFHANLHLFTRQNAAQALDSVRLATLSTTTTGIGLLLGEFLSSTSMSAQRWLLRSRRQQFSED